MPGEFDRSSPTCAQIYAAVDLLAGPLFRALVGEAQHDRQVAVALNERLITPQADKTVARLKAARDQGQLSPGFDLDLSMAILSGPLYFQLLITQEPLTHEYVDRVIDDYAHPVLHRCAAQLTRSGTVVT
ncbi:TetR-like C-terminal domain-containing protein [Dactylosporangium sp. NPDC049140]|uniref:TetR-like C-terminal domain-containing protein n=1 Tax=Dactylosporangium sp. NPDC049140 TaxID=3155647 RepID=UPI0033C704DA